MMTVAIIGCGAIVSDLHVPILRRLEREGHVRVVSAVDPDPRRTGHVRRSFPAARPFRDVDEAMSAMRPRLSLVASPVGHHLRHVRAALSAGSHVLCEKPLAASGSEAREAVRLAREAGLKLMVVLPRRFYPNVRTAAGLIRDGVLGSPLRFAFREGGIFAWPITTDAAFRRALSRGGVLRDKGAHVLDTVHSLFGPMRVVRCCDDSLKGGVEGNVIVGMANERAVGSIQLSWDQTLRDGLHVIGPERELWLGQEDLTTLRIRRPGGVWTSLDCDCVWPADVDADSTRSHRPVQYYECAELLWVQFLRVVLGIEDEPVSVEVAAEEMEWIDAAYACARPMDLPWLDPAERMIHRARHWRSEDPVPTGGGKAEGAA